VSMIGKSHGSGGWDRVEERLKKSEKTDRQTETRERPPSGVMLAPSQYSEVQYSTVQCRE
jgi:hypothetical protein